jgi:hypothetical protein
MPDDAFHFRLFQCAICGKMVKSEDAQQEHERKCRRDTALLHRNEACDELLARGSALMSRQSSPGSKMGLRSPAKSRNYLRRDPDRKHLMRM